jgi:hypothetical protein
LRWLVSASEWVIYVEGVLSQIGFGTLFSFSSNWEIKKKQTLLCLRVYWIDILQKSGRLSNMNLIRTKTFERWKYDGQLASFTFTSVLSMESFHNCNFWVRGKKSLKFIKQITPKEGNFTMSVTAWNKKIVFKGILNIRFPIFRPDAAWR